MNKRTFIVTMISKDTNIVVAVNADTKKKAKRIAAHNMLLKWSTPHLFNMFPKRCMSNNPLKTIKKMGFKVHADTLDNIMI